MTEPIIHTVNHDDPDFDMRRHKPEQRDLDLMLPESLQKVRREVAAIHAVPSNPDSSQSLNNRRLFDALIMGAQMYFNERGREYTQRAMDERISPLFEIRISELAKMAEIPGKNFERLHQEIDQLYDWSFDWHIVGGSGEVVWANKARLLSSRGIGMGFKRGLIRFAMDPGMLAIILEPNLWASLALQATGGLGTAASYSLFQTCWRYIDGSEKETPALPTQIWVELLVGKNRYIREEGGKVTINYGDFKRRVLLDAIQRVNDIPALTYELELKEYRQGNRVSRLQFKFLPKQATLVLPLSWPDKILSVLNGLGFSEKELSDISQAYSVEVVGEGIDRLKATEEKLSTQSKTISEPKPYFLRLLRAMVAGENEIDHERIEAEIRQESAQKAADERERKVLAGFEEHRRRRFRGWLLSLSSAERNKLVSEFRKHNGSNPAAADMEQKLEADDRATFGSLREWLEKHRPSLIDKFFENPEDKNIQAWMAWRLSGDDAIPG